MGNEEEGTINLQKNEFLNIEFKKDGYFENQLVEGELLFHSNKDLKLDEISIHIRMLQSFKITESKNKVITNSIQKKIFSKKFNLPKIFNSKIFKNIPIPPALHKIPFRIFLPKNIPPSFEYPRENKKGYIRYIFTAEVITVEEKFITDEYLILKQRPYNFPLQIRTKQRDKKAIKTAEKLIKGESSISLYSPNLNVIINNPIDLEIEIDNSKCEDDIINIYGQILRIVTFKKDGESFNFETIIVNKKYTAKCAKKEKKMFKFNDMILRDADLKEIYFSEKMHPYLGKITDLNILMPSVETPIMKCEYKLIISPNFTFNVLENDRPMTFLPIYATHQTPKDCETDKIIIQGQIKNIPLDVGQYAPIYVFKDENNNNYQNNYNMQNNNNMPKNNNNIMNNNNLNNNKNNNIDKNMGNNNFGNNNIRNGPNSGNSGYSTGQIPFDDANQNASPITCNDFPTLASINRVIQKRDNNNFNNGQEGNNQNNQYNPYDNIFL